MERYYACANPAFEELQNRYDTALRAYFRRRGLSPGDIDDLCQHVWIRIVTTKGSPREAEAFTPPAARPDAARFDASRTFRPWLYRIASNEMVSFWRKDGRRRMREAPLPERTRSDGTVTPLELPDATAQIDAVLLEEERLEAVRACRDALDETAFAVLHHSCEGRTLEEIAALFERNVAWAFRTKRRAIEQIGQCLATKGMTGANEPAGAMP
jgi:RNA polymerase sigma factor (sigma-70 family)